MMTGGFFFFYYLALCEYINIQKTFSHGYFLKEYARLFKMQNVYPFPPHSLNFYLFPRGGRSQIYLF